MKEFYSMGKILMCFVTCIITGLVADINAQELSIPANLQAAVFKKIFLFNKTLQDKGNIEIAVLSKDGSGDEITEAFKNAGINAKMVTGGQIPSSSTVIYLMPGVASPKQYCTEHGVLSISGTGSDIEEGKASVGLTIEEGKPKIIVNLSELKAEKQDISSQVLSFAKIIQ